MSHVPTRRSNMRNHLAVAVFGLALALPWSAHASQWDIDTAHSSAQFAVRHMMVSTVRGEFTKLTGAVTLDDKDITRSSVNATIDATSVNTREEKRDAHLKSPDFFDVAKHPTITFKSKKITRGSAKDRYNVT